MAIVGRRCKYAALRSRQQLFPSYRTTHSLRWAPASRDLSPADLQRQPLQRVIVAAGSPRMNELVAIGIKMEPMWRSQYLAAPEQDLQRLGRRHTRAELASHDGRRPALFSEIDCGRVNQIGAMQPAGAKPTRKRRAFSSSGRSPQRKYSSKLILPGRKLSKRRTHAERRCGDSRNAGRRTCGKGGLACGKRKEVQAVDVHVHPGQEVGQVRAVHAMREEP